MDYKLEISGKTWDIKAKRLDDGRLKVTIDDQTKVFSASATAPNKYVLKTDDGLLKLIMVKGPAGLWIWSEGRARLVLDAGRQDTHRASGGGSDDTPQEVTPFTPATVISIATKVGDAVVKGQALVVVSAMKMETTLTAPYDGVVTAINTEPGANVSPGEILVELEAAEVEKGAEEDE